MKYSGFKHSGSETKILPLGDIRARISPKMLSHRLLLTGQTLKSSLNPRAHHWATLTCHSSHKTLASLHTIKIHKQSLSN
jgi:hypothetical protein